MKLNLGAGKVPREGYLSVDKARLPTTDVLCDLFVFPWPFKDESVDEIYASHLIEHTSHTMRKWIPNWRAKFAIYEPMMILEPLWEEDGFVTFFRECHRILKPDGLVELIGPYFRSTGADQDFSHTRYITENTFSYLWQWSETFDYQLGFSFTQEEFTLSLNPEWAELSQTNPDVFQYGIKHLWNVASSFRTVLRKV